jgi:hypothetical protein
MNLNAVRSWGKPRQALLIPTLTLSSRERRRLGMDRRIIEETKYKIMRLPLTNKSPRFPECVVKASCEYSQADFDRKWNLIDTL